MLSSSDDGTHHDSFDARLARFELHHRVPSGAFGPVQGDHTARSGRCASVSAIHSSSVIAPPRAPGVASLRREAIETVEGADGKSTDLGFEAAARILL